MENENFNLQNTGDNTADNSPTEAAAADVPTAEQLPTEQPAQPAVYSYTTESKPAFEEPRPEPQSDPQGEPTVRFDTVNKPQEHSTNTGIKVFFSMLAVTVALIIAVSAGYIFGSRSETNSLHFTASTPLVNKDETQHQSDLTAVFNNVDPSVVAISVYTDKGIQGYASGVVYTADGYIVTNDHIYSEVASPKFLVTLNDGTQHKAEFVAGDTRSDLAVLKINATGLKKADFGNSDQVAVGEEVIAIGYPSGVEGGSILTAGTISSSSIRFTSTSTYSVRMIQTDTAINPGNSGGALVNMYSQVIGIPSVKMAGTEYDNVGYAIPSSTVVKVADSLIKNGYVAGRGRLGITYIAVDRITAELENIPTGLRVQEVTIDSDLNGKGIKTGDIITHINDIEITESGVALDIIESTEPGVTMSFTVYHAADGRTETVYASLIPDQGNSSYTNQVAEDGESDPFGSGSFDDFFSDH